MDIGAARDSATLTVIGDRLAGLDAKLGQVQETVTNLAVKVADKLDEVLRRLPPQA